MTVIERIKAVNAERIDLDGAVELLALGVTIVATYAANQLEVPSDLQEGVDGLKKLVATKRQEAIARKLREARARRSDLATAQEKREKLDEEIARLEALSAPQAAAQT